MKAENCTEGSNDTATRENPWIEGSNASIGIYQTSLIEEWVGVSVWYQTAKGRAMGKSYGSGGDSDALVGDEESRRAPRIL